MQKAENKNIFLNHLISNDVFKIKYFWRSKTVSCVDLRGSRNQTISKVINSQEAKICHFLIPGQGPSAFCRILVDIQVVSCLKVECPPENADVTLPNRLQRLITFRFWWYDNFRELNTNSSHTLCHLFSNKIQQSFNSKQHYIQRHLAVDRSHKTTYCPDRQLVYFPGLKLVN